MTCASCGSQCEVIEHHFYEGVAPESMRTGEAFNPVRRWTVRAPLYCRMTPDFAKLTAPFCSLKCSAGCP